MMMVREELRAWPRATPGTRLLHFRLSLLAIALPFVYEYDTAGALG